jgi:cell division septum initiation protein DivIVA
MDERRLPSSTHLGSAEIARANFAVLRKGFDPEEVHRYLETVAREVARLESHIRDLQEQLSDAKRQALNPHLDEETLVAALGAQSAAILRAAHEEAGRVTAEAQVRATQIFTQAQERGTASIMEAQERASQIMTDTEQAVAAIDLDARGAAERLVDSAKVNGDALVERAREQGRAIVEQAQEARKVVLNDLAVKRTALHQQIDQLRAARDSLSTLMGTVSEQIEHVVSGINTSDEDARAAALEALRSRKETPTPSEEELLAGVPLRHVPDAPIEEIADNVPPPAAPRSTRKKETIVEVAVVESTVDEAPLMESVLTETGLLDPDAPDTDVVEEIFARLRRATLEERGATAPAPKKQAISPREPSTPVDELFLRRDQALEGSLLALTRKVKRALQDDQNIMLERLRNVKAMITTELEDEHEQRNRYADAAADALLDAALAGVHYAREEASANGLLEDDGPISECAADLAVTIVVALRRRILSEGSGDGLSRANAAYKEWRGARVERLCTDAARRAFHQGVVAAAKGRSLRFIAAPHDVPCDACALDSSSPERVSGESFPSGSAYPPLHAGCACTIVPV